MVSYMSCDGPGLESEIMQRLIEQPADEGDILEGSRPLGRVHYHLSVYQHFSEADAEPLAAGALEVEGHISPLEPLDMAELHIRRPELTLRLADGRTLDFTMANADGTIRSTARGLYRL
jgi:hypothetical protein